MNWDDLRIVLAAARHRTLSAAAAALGVTHTTVSRRLRCCEDQLGARLFDRMPDGLHATAVGEEVIALAERMEGDVHTVQSRVMGHDSTLHGTLRVSVLDFFLAFCHPAFSSFFERYPSVEVTLTSPWKSVSLTRREADVALRLTPAPPEGLVGRRIGKLSFAAYASRGLADRIGTVDDYAAYPWLSFDDRIDNPWFRQWMATHASGAEIVAHIDESSTLIRELVKAGIGIFFLPIVEGEALGLRRIGPVLSELATDVWLLTLRDLRHTSRVRAFLDHMAEALPPLIATPGPCRSSMHP